MVFTFDPANGGIVGSVGEVVRVVTADDTALAVGSGDLPVLATPIMIALMEAAACRALTGYLPAVNTSVGSQVDVRHLAPTVVGASVTAHAVVTEVRGARVMFDVSATQSDDGRTLEIGRGSHVRVIVQREAFLGQTDHHD